MPGGDSISRFDSSRDMFSVRTSPVEQKIAARNKGASGKDTIETRRIQMKKMGPMMILTRGTEGSGGRAVKIARAGRFIFFALALPPFVALYSIPKWVFVNVIPQLFKQVEKGLHHAKQFFQHLIKVLTGGAESPFRNLLGRIKWRSGGVEKQHNSLLSYMHQKFTHLGSAVYKAGAKMLHLMVKGVERPWVALKERLSVVSKETSRLAASVVAKAREVVQPMVQWMLPKVHAVRHGVELALGWGREKIERGLDALKRSILPKIKEAQKIYESFQTTVTQKAHAISLQIVQVAQPVINLCIPTMQFLKEHLSLGLGWLSKKPKESLWKMHQRAQKFLAGVSPYAKKFYERSNQQLQIIIRWFWGPFLQFLARLFPFVPWFFKWLWRGVCKAFAFIKAALLFGGRFVKGRTQRFHHLLVPIKDRGVSLGNSLMNEGKALLKAPGAYLLGLLHKTLRLALKVVKVTAILVIGVGLVFKYWCIMLFELSEEFGGWLETRRASKS